jgi:hypothetical protein
MTGVIAARSTARYCALMPNSADTSSSGQQAPLGQRLFDNIFLLLALGLLVVFALYTGWGLWEILSLPPARLP